MSKELTKATSGFLRKFLKDQQDIRQGNAWCNREPQTWMDAAKHIMEPTTSIECFLRKHRHYGIKRNAYYDLKRDMLKDPECTAIRAIWADELASVQFQGIDNLRQTQEKYSEMLETGQVSINAKEMAFQVKSMMGIHDMHSKLTGNNVQIHRVEHVGQEDYEAKMAELRARIETKKAEAIDVD